MECNYAAQVSLLIDGEISSEESEKIRKHIGGCKECQDLEKDFLFFREQIKDSSQTKDFVLPRNLSEKKAPFWKRVIPIPAPVFVGVFIAFIVLGIFFWHTKNAQKEQLAKTPKSVSGENSLARFDKGGKAEIYVLSSEQK